MNVVVSAIRKVRRWNYSCMNTLAPHLRLRWIVTISLLIGYLATSSHPCSDITTYLLAFYLLLLTANYFTPRGAQDEDYDEEEQSLYSLNDSLHSLCNASTNTLGMNIDRADDKPLVRSMNERDVWQRTTIAFALSLLCSYFQMMEIDVFWPLLLLYFAVIALYTVLKILKTMHKYSYSLADFKKGSSASQT